jgi:hypothetical protein
LSEPTPRQVLYALVSGGFLVVVLVLVVGAAAARLVPTWWTVAMLLATVGIGVWSAFNWHRTSRLLLASIGLFVIWTVGTLVVI